MNKQVFRKSAEHLLFRFNATMKKQILLFTLVFAFIPAFGQLIVTDPALPVENLPVTVIFDATQGNKGLMNYTGDDVYAHTGVITDKSTSPSDWKYVKAAWNVNLPECKLTKIEPNKYQISLGPSIRDFYGVPAGEKILKMCFVFRNSTGSVTGRDVGGADIFVPVYEPGLAVSFVRPSRYFTILGLNETLNVEINFKDADSAALFLDGIRKKASVSSPLTWSFTASGYDRHLLVATAWKGQESASDTVWYLVRGNTVQQTVPTGKTDGLNYDDPQTVTFVLYAPYKNHVYLLGDFNNWLPDNSYLLKKDNDRFWYTLTGLTPGKEYIFQYLVDDSILIADPYCEKISDPWNDKYIPERIYPNLIKYPEGKTTEIAGVLQTNQPDFPWEEPVFKAPSADTLVIYELLIRDFTDNRDIKTVTDTLDYLKRLGVNAVELMPFSEFEGNDSWGYNPSFYFAPDKAYGTKDDYKKFIDECHKRGMAVIMDIVLNHTYGSSPMVRLYFAGGKPTAQNPWYNQTSPNPTYSWGYDFNHESPATQYFVDRVLRYWVNEYKIDGFRFDFSKGFTNTPGDGWAYDPSRISILKRMADAIRSVKPDVLLILEHFTDNSEEKELASYGFLLWGNMNSKYNEATMGYNDSGKSDFTTVSYLARGWSEPNLVGYMESHDEERLNYKNITYGNSFGTYNIKFMPTAVKRMELASVFFYPVAGPKMIWQFGELGYDISINFNGRLGIKPAKWDYYENINRKRLFTVTSKLITLKKTEPVFQTSDYYMNVGGAIKTIRWNGTDNTVIAIGNFDVTPRNYTVNFPSAGTWYDYFWADSLVLENPSVQISLQPGEYRFYSSKKLNGFGSINIGFNAPIASEKIRIYPNPARNQINITSAGKIKSIVIYTLS
ncbi:MAG: alpha-amylase, partial [Bacteroidales bacterium]|nr:alpha-amylase [Bacteroidales bacterium]